MPYRSIPSVFAIGFVEAKGYCNVIPDSVELKGLSEQLMKSLSLAHTQMQEIASSIAKEYSLDVNFNILKGYPSLTRMKN